MAVVIETTLGDITVDLYVEKRPLTCLNFLKLCKMKYYNYNLFHTIQHGFIAQTGDPTGKGDGGQSIWGVLEGPHKQYFEAEQIPKVKHSDPGLLSMVGVENRMVGSQFFITLASDLTSLDGQHCVIGEVTEGMDILRLLNETICDSTHRPYQDVRITHTVVLDDPFNDPPNLNIPSRSPSPSAERLAGGRIAPDEEIDDTEGKTEEEIAEMIRAREAKARATILEIVGDLPDADMAPPENVLFVCKLNPVTSDDDLEIIFSRFGKINSCEVIRDKKTGDSLQYAFIEFDNKKSCEDAYFKMDNVLIDDRRIHVDFSQSVSKIKWRGKGRGVIHMDAHGKPVPDLDFNPNNERRDQNTRAYKGSNRNVSDYKESSYRSKNKEYSSEVRKRDRSPHSPKYNKYQESDSRYDGRNEKKYNELKGSRNRSKDKEYERKRNHSPDRNSKYLESNSQYYDSRNDKKYKEQSDYKESRHRSKDKEYSGSARKRDRSRSPNRNVPNYKESKHHSRDKGDKKRNRSPHSPKYNKYRECNSRYDSRNEKSYKKRTSKE